MTLPPALYPLKRLAWRMLLGRRRMVAPPFTEAIHHDIQGRLDYARAAALTLALIRIDTEAVPGALAEVGVFRGETRD